MASGKSSVGKRVSELAGRPFIDLDSRIEARFSAPITRIFSEQFVTFWRFVLSGFRGAG